MSLDGPGRDAGAGGVSTSFDKVLFPDAGAFRQLVDEHDLSKIELSGGVLWGDSNTILQTRKNPIETDGDAGFVELWAPRTRGKAVYSDIVNTAELKGDGWPVLTTDTGKIVGTPSGGVE